MGDEMLSLVASALVGGDCIDDAETLCASGRPVRFPPAPSLFLTRALFARWPSPPDRPMWASIERWTNFAAALPSLVLGQAVNRPCSVPRLRFRPPPTGPPVGRSSG